MTLSQINKPADWPVGEWKPPADWLPLPDLVAGQQKCVALFAVFNHDSNYAAVSCVITAGYTVDWGDGSAPENFLNNQTGQHQYNFATMSNATLTSEGFKQAIITITPQSGNITAFNLSKRHTALPAILSSTSFLDVKMVGANVNSVTMVGTGPQVEHRYLKRFEYVGTSVCTTLASLFLNCTVLEVVKGTAWTGLVTTMTNMFQGCSSLRTVPLLDTHSMTVCNSMFSGCSSLTTVPLFDTHLSTNMSSMFNSCVSIKTLPLFNTSNNTTWTSFCNACTGLQSVPLWDTSKGTNFTNMFAGCISLRSIPLFDTHLGQIFSGMFSGAGLQILPALDMSGASSAANFANVFNSTLALGKSEVTGVKYTHAYINSRMSAAELNRVYTNLAASSPAGQVITVTGNPGVAGDDPSIATAKGWTVTGS